ncbi:hypothetical protein [Natrinema marinum]|uniref:hypothetical protein n=1 Tax=Natrinema marinum TaxID=2961598 RepID=UPI0020C91708|nr:hypothetical protein [Natrinema marinum]
MNRRTCLTTAIATASLAAIAGCSRSDSNETGRTYTLSVADDSDDAAGDVLDFDATGLASGQSAVLEEAIRTGSYSEAGVNWSSFPGRTGITMEFRTVIQLIARHVGRDPEINRTASFATPCRYDGQRYRAAVDVTSER